MAAVGVPLAQGGGGTGAGPRRDHETRPASGPGSRAPEEPRRFTSITLHYTITGEVPEAMIERAIQLSREKYCSVWHSMRQDIELTVTYKVTVGL